MWVLITSLLIEHMALGQDLFILTAMTLRRGHESDAAMAVLVVVPEDEITYPDPCCVQTFKAASRPLRAVFQGSKQ